MQQRKEKHVSVVARIPLVLAEALRKDAQKLHLSTSAFLKLFLLEKYEDGVNVEFGKKQRKAS